MRAHIRGGQRVVCPHVQVGLGQSESRLVGLNDVDEGARQRVEIRGDLLDEVVDLVFDRVLGGSGSDG